MYMYLFNCVRLNFLNLPISWKNFIGLMQIVYKKNIVHNSFVVVGGNRNLPFSHFKLLCIFPSDINRTGCSYQSSSFFFFFGASFWMDKGIVM